MRRSGYANAMGNNHGDRNGIIKHSSGQQGNRYASFNGWGNWGGIGSDGSINGNGGRGEPDWGWPSGPQVSCFVKGLTGCSFFHISQPASSTSSSYYDASSTPNPESSATPNPFDTTTTEEHPTPPLNIPSPSTTTWNKTDTTTSQSTSTSTISLSLTLSTSPSSPGALFTTHSTESATTPFLSQSSSSSSSSSTTTSSSQPTPASINSVAQNARSAQNRGAIAAGVLAALALILLVIVASLLFRARRRRANQVAPSAEFMYRQPSPPFMRRLRNSSVGRMYDNHTSSPGLPTPPFAKGSVADSSSMRSQWY